MVVLVVAATTAATHSEPLIGVLLFVSPAKHKSTLAACFGPWHSDTVGAMIGHVTVAA